MSNMPREAKICVRPDLVSLPLNGLQGMGGRSVCVGSRGILVIPKRNCTDADYWLCVSLEPDACI